MTDLSPWVPAMVWHLNSQQAGHRRRVGGDDNGRIVEVVLMTAEMMMKVAVAMVLLISVAPSCTLAWACLWFQWKASWFFCLWLCHLLDNASNTFLFCQVSQSWFLLLTTNNPVYNSGIVSDLYFVLLQPLLYFHFHIFISRLCVHGRPNIFINLFCHQVDQSL